MVSDTFFNMFTQGHSPQSLGPDPSRRKWSFAKDSTGYLERTYTVSNNKALLLIVMAEWKKKDNAGDPLLVQFHLVQSPA